jgi:hypothetical protein
MAIEGPLRELSIHDVFQLLDLSRKTGVLRVESDLRSNAGTIYFQEGSIVYAEIRSNPHLLGELLVRTGRITRGELEEARELQRRQGEHPRIGEILVSLGAITNRDLQRHVRLQVEEVVFEVTSWTEGHFSFTEGRPDGVPPDSTVRIRRGPHGRCAADRRVVAHRETRVLHLGVARLRRRAPRHRGAADLPRRNGGARADRMSPRRAHDRRGAGAVGLRRRQDALRPGERRCHRSARAADARAGPAVRLATTRSRSRGGTGAADLEGARAAAEQVVTALPQDASAHLTLGRVHLAAGRPQAALESLARAVRLDARLAAAHRVQGYALAALGRFQEAVESWDQWERLAPRATGEAVHSQAVEQARAAARLLAGAIAHG